MTTKKRFQHFQEKYPQLSSFINLGRAIQGMGLTREEIIKSMKWLDKEDVKRSDKPSIVSHFAKLTKTASNGGFVERAI